MVYRRGVISASAIAVYEAVEHGRHRFFCSMVARTAQPVDHDHRIAERPYPLGVRQCPGPSRPALMELLTRSTSRTALTEPGYIATDHEPDKPRPGFFAECELAHTSRQTPELSLLMDAGVRHLRNAS